MDQIQLQIHNQWLNDPQTIKLRKWLEEQLDRTLKIATGHVKMGGDDRVIANTILTRSAYEDTLKQLTDPYRLNQTELNLED